MISMSCRIDGGDFDKGGQATRRLKEQLSRVGVAGPTMRRAMIAAYEAEMNVVIHARTGTLWARLDSTKLDLEVADEGPGIPDLELALREGWSTASAKAREMGFGAGMGLPNIRRNSDLFDIETRIGRGTRIRSTILLSPQMTPSSAIAHPADEEAAGISPERCRKCLRCIFSCPTGALRVHAAGPVLRTGLCVGCTECISACPSAVFGIREPAAEGGNLPAPGEDAVLVVPRAFLASPLAGRSPEHALAALAGLGFSEVRFTEEWSDAMEQEARAAASRCGPVLPLIPPLCPAVTALVESRFPSLIPNLAKLASPLEAAGEEFPLRPVVLLAACPAQSASARGSSLTGRLTVLSPARLSAALHAAQSSATASGSTRRPALRAPRARPEPVEGELTVSGARAVMRALAAAEAGALSGATVLNLRLCEQGCSGSPLVCPDPFLAELGWRRLPRFLDTAPASDAGTVRRSRPYSQRAGMRLDVDMASAIRALGRIDELVRALPGRDCGACGAPACALFAEDVVMGRVESSACPHARLIQEVSR